MSKSPTITIGNLAKEVFCIYTDSSSPYYGWLDSNFLYPPVSGSDIAHNDLTGLQGGTAGEYYHLTSAQVALLHTRLHSITGTSDHSFPGGTSTFLRADGSFATPSSVPAAHSDTHQVSGTDEINVADLSGELADIQKIAISCDPLVSNSPPNYTWFHIIPSGSTWVTVADDTVLKKKNVTIYSPTGFPTAVKVEKGGILAGTRGTVNFMDGAGITVLPIDNPIADRVDVTISGHAQQHAITGTADHTSAATAGKILKADASGLPIEASNTDAQVSGAVAASHVRQHAITGTADHTSAATVGYMLKADASGLPIQATNTDAQVAAAVANMTVGTVTTVTGTYNVLVTDQTVVCNSTSAFTVTLPVAVVGQYFHIKNINTGTVTIQGQGGTDTIDGVTTQQIVQWDSVRVQCYVANKWGVE